jgi:hypothetical protein
MSMGVPVGSVAMALKVVAPTHHSPYVMGIPRKLPSALHLVLGMPIISYVRNP